MNAVLKVGLASAVLALTAATNLPATAADLGGSIKDHGYVAPMPVIHRSAAGPCYVRGDVGGVVSGDPDGRWDVSNEVFLGDANVNGIIDADEVDDVFVGDAITSATLENTWLLEVGAGCGSGSQGFRGEVSIGFRGTRDFDGVPTIYEGTLVGQPVGTTPGDIDDPIHTSIKSHTMMANLYYDFGLIRGFVPYVGAGIGAAYHKVDEVYFTENPALVNRIEENQNLTFAWSLMAGVGYQLSPNAILDLGYRYIDMGHARSGRVDSAGFANPAVRLDDLTAHEFKVGMRYHFGGGRGGRYLPTMK